MLPPLMLSAHQLEILQTGALPLAPWDRVAFRERVAELLYAEGGAIGDGVVARACRAAQQAFLTPPIGGGHNGRPRKYG
jgi:hypothetical protein